MPDSADKRIQRIAAPILFPENTSAGKRKPVAGQQSPLSRYAPLALKNWFLRSVYRHNGYSTTVLSNLGKIHPRKEFAPCIVEYRCLLPLTEREPLKIAACAYRNTLSLTIRSSLRKDRFPDTLMELLTHEGIPVRPKAGGTDSRGQTGPLPLSISPAPVHLST